MRLILEARVYVNGRVVVDCSTRVNAADAVAVDGNLLEVGHASSRYNTIGVMSPDHPSSKRY